jgi:hypothetical protein
MTEYKIYFIEIPSPLCNWPLSLADSLADLSGNAQTLTQAGTNNVTFQEKDFGSWNFGHAKINSTAYLRSKVNKYLHLSSSFSISFAINPESYGTVLHFHDSITASYAILMKIDLPLVSMYNIRISVSQDR